MGELARILVVDDDLASRGLMAQILAEDGHQVTVASDGAEALNLLRDEQQRGGEGFDAVVSDIRMVEADGLEVLDWVAKNAVETPVVLVTAFGNVDGAVDAIRRGAYDYISKPYDVNAIKLVVDRALRHRRLSAENRRLKREIREKYALQNVVGRSEAMLQVYKTAARVASTDATVLVVGESGTGKELVARAIHGASRRAQGSFIAVDCGAIAEGVLESELFGHARGSFTGATGARRGLFEEASGGTLFLDEIGDIGQRIQGQLLRVVQEGEIRRVGESSAVKVDTRVVAATNKDLAAEVKAGRFREDLFYRLNVVTIRLPPLRERPEDIPLLAEHFAARHAGARGANITNEAREAMLAYGWPGNVRELENAVARALALNPGGTILPEDLPEAVRDHWRTSRGLPDVVPTPPQVAVLPAPPAPPAPDPLLADRPTLDELNRRYAERILRDLGGNKTRAAEALGIDRKTLSRLVGPEE
ncbi:MAG: sigma-54-dependent Fis family transcriptional regulator [Deltaproteobacteria bacterium]|nr:MAG: sigma-54-dependent Fis family transcriptional regulator [Deltaproteobacteria bacterium]